MMEKENKRFREEGIREFNEAVRSLVAFVKKRDPRFKPNVQTEAERQKNLRDAAVAQAARSRAANRAKNVPKVEAVPEWMQSSDFEEDNIADEVEDTAKEQVECVVCKKSFKSEKQYEAHEKSKKHVRAVQHIRRQMQQEDKSLELNDADQQSSRKTPRNAVEEPDDSNIIPASEIASGEIKTTKDMSCESVSEEDSTSSTEKHGAAQGEGSRLAPILEPSASFPDDECNTRENVEYPSLDRKHGADAVAPGFHGSETDIIDVSEKLLSESLSGQCDLDPQPKVGKAKEKRAKKAAQNSAAHPGPEKEYTCTSCQAGFPSKSRLFSHIKDFGHAAPVSKPTKGGKGKKR